ncbi:MAG: FAD-dependent oxidoreductase [Gammaproteobacteria bacterium]|nr:FAD-dependent oxidoreductase [Gammaproteobacteria bacterium]
MAKKRTIHTDAVIIGGGIAGLWLLNALRRAGYGVVLLESHRLGSSQTLASQGMIHGGLKYALGGVPSRASETIASMPGRWRACLDGDGELDLTGLAPLSEHTYLFAEQGGLGPLSAFLASKALQSGARRLRPEEYPEFLRSEAFKGIVYRLNDFVLDPVRLIERLASLGAPHLYTASRIDRIHDGADTARIEIGNLRIACRRLILAAGAGNEALLKRLGLPVAMQRRSLHQVVVRHPALGPFFGHCLTDNKGAEPRLTITSHPAGSNGDWLWSVGGRLATGGSDRSVADQRQFARRELAACVPWIDWQEAEIACYRLDRAEPRQAKGQRPDEAFAEVQSSCIVCWPTKLTLTPDLGQKVLAFMPAPEHPAPPSLDLPPATIGAPPWAT